MQKLLTVQLSCSAADSSLETLPFSFTALQEEKKLIAKKTDEIPLDVRRVN